MQFFLICYILLSFQQLCTVAIITHFLHEEAEAPPKRPDSSEVTEVEGPKLGFDARSPGWTLSLRLVSHALRISEMLSQIAALAPLILGGMVIPSRGQEEGGERA